ncbi:hypothetical protein FZC76_21675 [Sutcliffiella horikoshii]|uniref:Uncharacterized protein n=1 Tax=Sutcliffiella horikoshii TaxID=79883 RepID=A0A5D4SA45_9BACI|nr:hypothetical protein [Sutcliffiella horikoshii]TYS60483.1 hypothetical protein FZC76_21675 [Sutcliffiella horikoshii]
MNLKKESCPSKVKNTKCDCKLICQELYGKEARRLRKEAHEAPPETREKKHREWQLFVGKYSKHL